MKKIVIFLGVGLLSVSAFAQQGASTAAPLDTIIRLGGKKLAVDVLNVSATDVTYRFPGETQNRTIERKQIEKIRYKSGNLDIFNKPVLQMINDNQWEAVLVTEKKDDVDGLYEYGIVEASSTSDARSPKAARRSATIRLQKKAANMGANIIFITKAEAVGGYGEIPGYNMMGVAYGFEKPSEEVQKKLQEAQEKEKKKK